jgi:hypothetical protein
MTRDRKTDFERKPFSDVLWEKSDAPKLLWHYTDALGLIGIANSKSLWCTEHRFLNDREEITIFVNEFHNRLREVLKDRLSGEEIEKALELSNLYRTWYVFVSSFCTDSDRNEHWHQYAKRAGYALGFDAQMLRSLARRQQFMLGPVLYGSEPALNIATGYIEDYLSSWQSFTSPLSTDALNKLVHSIISVILQIAAFFKHRYFEREHEWRLIKVLGVADEETISCRTSKSFGLISYCSLDFKGETEAEFPKNLIPRIIVGPGNETVDFLRNQNVLLVFNKNGFETGVSDSSSSLRFAD